MTQTMTQIVLRFIYISKNQQLNKP